MPLYEYECTNCQERLEKRQKFSDPPLTECPTCGGKLEKCLSAPAVQFKGGGWYADLYSSSGAKKKSGDAKASGTSSSSSSDSSSSAASTTPAAPAASSASSDKK